MTAAMASAASSTLTGNPPHTKPQADIYSLGILIWEVCSGASRRGLLSATRCCCCCWP